VQVAALAQPAQLSFEWVLVFFPGGKAGEAWS